MSEPPERHSPTLQSRARVPGQRVDVDGKMLENSFRGNDDQSRVRRQVLNYIQRQSWFHSNQDEPKMDANTHRDILDHGLGMVGRSIYTVFLVEDKDSNQWRCLFGSEDMSCKKNEKRFERVERAIEHVRSHLGHRPFACDGTCHKAKSTGIGWSVDASFLFCVKLADRYAVESASSQRVTWRTTRNVPRSAPMSHRTYRSKAAPVTNELHETLLSDPSSELPPNSSTSQQSRYNLWRCAARLYLKLYATL
jgi:hypothetical protein